MATGVSNDVVMKCLQSGLIGILMLLGKSCMLFLNHLHLKLKLQSIVQVC